MPSRRRLLCAVGGAAAAGLAGCTDDVGSEASPGTDPDTEWPQPGGTDRFDCYRKDAAAPRTAPERRWTAETGEPKARPVVADGRVLLLTERGLTAYDLESGEQRWRTSGGPEFTSRTAPNVVDGTAYLGTTLPDGMVAVDVEDGERRWAVELGARPSTPPVVDVARETLAVGTEEGLVGLTVDGERRWTRETFSRVSALVSWRDVLCAGTRGGELLAFFGLLDPRGSWRRDVDGGVTQVALLDGSSVVVSTSEGPVSRRNASRGGAARWKRDVGGSEGVVVGPNTYAVGPGLASVGTRTGEGHWQVDDALEAAPAGAGDTVYSGGDGFIAAYGTGGGAGIGGYRFGAERWRHDVDGSVSTGVSVADGAVFGTAYREETGVGTLYALE